MQNAFPKSATAYNIKKGYKVAEVEHDNKLTSKSKQLFHTQKIQREPISSDKLLVINAITISARILGPKNKFGEIDTPEYPFFEYSKSSDKSFMKNFYNDKKRIFKQNAKFNPQFDKDNKEHVDINTLQTDNRISYLGFNCRTKTPRVQLVQIAKKFSRGIEKFQNQENSSKYQYIFKNLLREIKIFYQEQLHQFQIDENIEKFMLKKQRDQQLPYWISYRRLLICKQQSKFIKISEIMKQKVRFLRTYVSRWGP